MPIIIVLPTIDVPDDIPSGIPNMTPPALFLLLALLPALSKFRYRK